MVVKNLYSQFVLKAVDDEKREISGVATTPTTDRVGDIVESKGAEFTLPIPLLWQHDSLSPIGNVTKAKVTSAGIEITARLERLDSPPALKNRLEEAWQSIKSGLVRGLSIGFSPIEYAFTDSGVHFLKWSWHELSAVTIPANAEASITAIKSADLSALRKNGLAASGKQNSLARPRAPGVTGKHSFTLNTGDPMDIFALVEELEEKRTELTTEMKGFGDVTDLDDEQAVEFDKISKDFEEVEVKLSRAKRMLKAVNGATRVVGDTRESAERSRMRVPAEPKKELPKGTLFTRYAMAIAAGRGSISDALEYAKRWKDQSPEVIRYIKAVSGTTVVDSDTWGGELAFQNNLAAEFVELLRPATVIGRISGFRMVPFNVRIPTQTGGSTVNWVGEGLVKPVTELAFSEITLDKHKIAGIIVLSEELVRLSSPSAEETVRRDMTEQVAQFMDAQFLTASVSETDNNPASITNGVSAVTASGTDAEALYTDLNEALSDFDTANMMLDTLHLVMPMALARGISTLRNALGQAEFPTMTPSGGTLLGYPVIVSNSCPAGTIVLVNASEIFLADDGNVRLDASNQATLDMAGGGTPNFSLWQRNCIGMRAERWITWEKRRTNAVALISSAAYGPSISS